MANHEWGTKRICQSCGTKFYDLKREPILCPKCHSEYDPEAFLKTRRTRAVAGAGAEKEALPVLPVEADVEIDDAEVLDDAVAGEAVDEEDEDLIEDASELGEDDDDMAEVIENVDDEEER